MQFIVEGDRSKFWLFFLVVAAQLKVAIDKKFIFVEIILRCVHAGIVRIRVNLFLDNIDETAEENRSLDFLRLPSEPTIKIANYRGCDLTGCYRAYWWLGSFSLLDTFELLSDVF